MKWQWGAFFVTFGTVFIAELGDKTQLATMNFAAKGHPVLSVFVGSALALVVAALIGTLVGAVLYKYVPPVYVSRVAGTLFIILGILILTGKI